MAAGVPRRVQRHRRDTFTRRRLGWMDTTFIEVANRKVRYAAAADVAEQLDPGDELPIVIEFHPFAELAGC